MKRLMLLVILALMLTSCQQAVADDGSEKWITANDSIDLSGMNLYRQNDHLSFKLDKTAKISLYVSADQDDDGVLMFDDRHEWLLVMETAFGDYPLFPRGYVQIGGVSYDVFYDYDNNEYSILHVIVTVKQTAGYEIYDCVFNDDKKAFKVIPVYNATNINFWASSR